MRNLLASMVSALVLVTCAVPAQAVPAGEAQGALFALPEGEGRVTLVWVPPPGGAWPAAWQVSDDSGRVLVPRVARGDAQATDALGRLDADSRDTVAGFDATYAKTSGEARMHAYVAAAARVLVDPDFARAMGAYASLAGVAPGARRYTVTALDAAGKATAPKLTSQAADAARPAPLPAMPAAVRAASVLDGAVIQWQVPAASREAPVYAHRIEQVAGNNVRVVAARQLVNVAARQLSVIDANVPRETEATWRIYAIGAGGRQSAPATVTLFVEDLAALVPPAGVRADAADGAVMVRWPQPPNAHTRGAVIERTQVIAGQWQVLGADPVTGNEFRDAAVQAGSTYWYRVRFMGPRGDLGEPSVPASARAQGSAPPPGVSGLAADAGRTRITLHWQPASTPVAGYRIERALGGDNWVAMAGALTREPRFDDDFPGGTDGVTVRYRVAPVAFDEQRGAWAEVSATLPDILSPPAPRITAVAAEPGKVTLTLGAAGLRSADRVLLLRANDATATPLVLGDPRPLAGTLDDTYATAGSTFWYRVVAVDAAGNRSDLSPPVMVRVPLATIPAAAPPVARFDANPLPHVTIRYPAAAREWRTVVQWRAGDGAWYVLGGPFAGAGEAVQVNVPRGVPLAYRSVWVDAAGNEGMPSGAITLDAIEP